MFRKESAALLPLSVIVLLLLLPAPASAQMLSKWGNPVISIGETPYHATSTGHGNYPGSNGFIPGYGYYPGDFPSRYPWLNGPDSPDYTRSGHGAPSAAYRVVEPAEGVPPAAALMTVRVPADAEIWFSGDKTAQQGAQRRFVTPGLEGGRYFTYEVRARWKENGKAIERVQTVRVHAGDRLTVDFLALPAPAEPLQMPRRFGEP
jgi:uncharacterized protein (TIGR03000 family)